MILIIQTEEHKALTIYTVMMSDFLCQKTTNNRAVKSRFHVEFQHTHANFY